MSPLYGDLPEDVKLAGGHVRISTDYRTGIKFEALLRDKKLPNREKLQRALRLYFGKERIPPELAPAAVDAIIDFYRCGEKPKKGPAEESGDGPEERVYDYEYDAGYFLAAFRQAYGIDLTTARLHWWQFRALFLALPEDCMLMKIIGYRSAKIPPKATPEQRQRIEEMKRIYALPIDADRQEFESDLTEILMRGGNPTAILEQEADRSWHMMEP